MALFKNLYLDVKSLNPFKKKKKEETNANYIQHLKSVDSHINDKDPKALSKTNQDPRFDPKKPRRELPDVSKRLLKKNNIKQKELPKIKPAPRYEPKKFTELDRPEIKPKLVTNETHTFFSNLNEHLNKEDQYLHSNVSKKVIYKNLYNEMQKFWDNQKYNAENETLHNALKSDIAKKVNELHDLEVEWQKLQLKHDRLKDDMSAKEVLIENKIKNLKLKFKKLYLISGTHEDHHFLLSNGTKLKSLQELQDELLTMNDEIYYNHVNEHRNDFANWVNDVMNLPELASSIKSAGSKLEMARSIENWTKTH